MTLLGRPISLVETLSSSLGRQWLSLGGSFGHALGHETHRLIGQEQRVLRCHREEGLKHNAVIRLSFVLRVTLVDIQRMGGCWFKDEAEVQLMKRTTATTRRRWMRMMVR